MYKCENKSINNFTITCNNCKNDNIKMMFHKHYFNSKLSKIILKCQCTQCGNRFETSIYEND